MGRIYSRSFAGGQISQEMFGRIDDAKYQAGAAVLKNFVVKPTGPAQNRAGFAFVKATKNNGRARLIPFTYSLDQTMVIELGDQYARFHTNGETLEYNPALVKPWVPPSGDLGYTYTAPTVITWPAHGLVDGDPIRFYQSGTTGTLPGNLVLGYTYTVRLIDVDTFNILDANGTAVAFTGGGGGGGGSTNYPGTGTPGASINLAPNQSSSVNSAAVGALANVPIVGGVVTLNIGYTVNISRYQSAGNALIEYSNDGGSSWNTFTGAGFSTVSSNSVRIALANLNLLRIRVNANGQSGPSGSIAIDVTVNSWSVDVPTGGGGGGTPATLRAYRFYTAGDTVSYGGSNYAAVAADSGGVTVPGTNAGIWSLLPADLVYEIPTPYVVDDLFGIHYAQSADVLTLVHPNYPPQELRRLGATSWSLTAIQFGPPLSAPLGVAAAASPGYLAKIVSISLANPALLTTAASHTLALGDGVYLANVTKVVAGVGTVLDGFYLVDKVPVDVDGNPIPTELNLMDYNGNVVDSSGWTSVGPTDGTKPMTLQLGSKIFNIVNDYAVVALGADGVSASALSIPASILDNLNVPGSFNTISWQASANATNYNVFKKFNGLWGFIGNTEALSFVDDNIKPDFSIVPGTPDPIFDSAGNYPGAVCYFQQRRCFAGSTNKKQNFWASNTATESMFSYSIPSLATDRISVRVAALKADQILHLVPMSQLIMLTSETEFAEQSGVNGNAVTPSSIDFKAQSYIGANIVQPTIINTAMVYAASRGGHVRELGYAWTVNGFQTGDLSLRAADLFDNYTIVDQTYSKSPLPVIWFVSSSGKLLGLTYIPEEQVGAWHWHDTQGSFESICSVAEGSEDVLYAVVNRTVNGATVRYVERMASRVIDKADPSTWFFVDAGITQSFVSPVTTISGLTWLEGCTVSVLADGCKQNPKTVVAGSIKLDRSAKLVTIGLGYAADLGTLPAVEQIDGFGQGTNKNISRAWVKFFETSQGLIGPDADHLEPIKQRTIEPWGTVQALQTGQLQVLTTPQWQEQGQVLIRQADPLPITVVGLTLEVVTGG